MANGIRRAVVMRAAGDSEFASALISGMHAGQLLISEEEFKAVRDQLDLLRIRDRRYWRRKIDYAELKYGQNPDTSRIGAKLLGLYGLFVQRVCDFYDRVNGVKE